MQADCIKILLVEDSEPDIELSLRSFKKHKLRNDVSVARDGEEALRYLNREGEFKDATTPDLILLDLNLPKMDGREVLEKIKKNEKLKTIPVVILTTSDADEDIEKTYKHHANCYIQKPVNLRKFEEVVNQIGEFWFSIVKLPPKN